MRCPFASLRPLLCLGAALMLVVLTGCAVPLKEEAAPPVTAPPRPPDYLAQGQTLESQGDLVSALRAYKLALTVDPADPAALDARSRVEAALNAMAAEHYQKGLAAARQGWMLQARRHFLTALRLRPQYPEALAALKGQVPAPEPPKGPYIVHKVAPGESLSLLAQRYYGDYRKYPIIAQYNRIKNPADLRVGQEIKIPHVVGGPKHEGAPEAEPKEREFTPPPLSEEVLAGAWKEQPEEPVPEAAEEPPDPGAGYREAGLELFSEGRYEEAVSEFNKALAFAPEDPVSLEYAYQCHFRLAMDLLKQKEYLPARDRFKMCLRYKQDCQTCHTYIKRCEDSYKEIHYLQGIRYFQEERLSEALREWEMVGRLDPNYKRLTYHIQKARTIQKKLEEIRRSQGK